MCELPYLLQHPDQVFLPPNLGGGGKKLKNSAKSQQMLSSKIPPPKADLTMTLPAVGSSSKPSSSSATLMPDISAITLQSIFGASFAAAATVPTLANGTSNPQGDKYNSSRILPTLIYSTNLTNLV